MYKITLYCEGCKTEVPERGYRKARLITFEKFSAGPWCDFDKPASGTILKKIVLCEDCIKKLDQAFNNRFDFLFPEREENAL